MQFEVPYKLNVSGVKQVAIEIKFSHFADALRLAQEHMSLAPHKIFFSYQGYAYLLGHRINYNTLEKLDKETLKKMRGDPITPELLKATHPRGDSLYDFDFDSTPLLHDIFPEDIDSVNYLLHEIAACESLQNRSSKQDTEYLPER